jgi:maleate isomerase
VTARPTHRVADEIAAPPGSEFAAPPPPGWQELDCALYDRALVKMGLVALANDPSAETDLHAFLAPFEGVRLSTNRVYSPRYSNLESLRAVGRDIAAAAAALMPDDPLDVIGFGCTSAAMVLGSEAVAADVRKRKPGVKVTDPIASALVALAALGAKRIALLTPYIGEVNRRIADYLEARGLALAARGFLRVYDDDQRNRVSADSLVAGSRRLLEGAKADALFISCTALRTAPVVARLESALSAPVVTSNQALAWNMLRSGGHSGRCDGLGSLFEL